MSIRFLTAGESHGKGLTVILEGFPAHLGIAAGEINIELSRRQKGYGRGGRMLIEKDEVEILSGVRNGVTIGSPITLFIKNKDYENWERVMTSDVITANLIKPLQRPRPGHADLSGGLKYNQKDLRNILERASARETTARVAAGAVAKKFLKSFGILVQSHVHQLGSIKSNRVIMLDDKINEKADKSPVRMIDKKQEKEQLKLLMRLRKKGTPWEVSLRSF